LANLTHNFTKRYYNQKEVIELSTLSRSTLERLERSNGMPAARRFGARCKRYDSTAIHAWLDGTWSNPDQRQVLE